VSKGMSMSLVILAVVLGACSGANAGTPTPSAEDVIRTAEALAQQTRQAATATLSPTAVTPTTPTATLVLATPTLAVSATPVVSGPVATANYPVAVRDGPGEQYEDIDLFLTGQMARVVGRYDDTPIGTWFLLQRIDVGLDGWVWSGAVTLTGDPALIPVITPQA